MSQVDPNLSLTESQDKMCGLVNNYRDSLMLSYFTYAGAQWNSDPQSVQNIMGTCMLAMMNGNNLPPGFMWRDYNNNMHVVTGMFMYGMLASGGMFQTLVYQGSWEHKAAILTIQDPIAVQEYDYMTTLWPSPGQQY